MKEAPTKKKQSSNEGCPLHKALGAGSKWRKGAGRQWITRDF